jgi:hypothetical protein
VVGYIETVILRVVIRAPILSCLRVLVNSAVEFTLLEDAFGKGRGEYRAGGVFRGLRWCRGVKARCCEDFEKQIRGFYLPSPIVVANN